MEIEKTAPQPISNALRPLSGGEFRFSCHPGISCFTECCRDLNLLLTPYDVVRLKNRLDLKSDDFLDRYADVRYDEKRHLPMVYLQMLDDDRRTCPFVSPQGCQVYHDRPSACRTYPLARASRKHRVHGTLLENYFVLRESHCKGFEEEHLWSVEEWIEDQGLLPYHEGNNLWMEIFTSPGLSQGTSEKQQQMLFMAGYNLDQFRRFLFGSRFLELFRIDPEEVESMRQDDEALLRLAFRWLRFSLLGEATLERRG